MNEEEHERAYADIPVDMKRLREESMAAQAERLTKAIQRNVALAMQVDDLRSVLSRLLANLAQREDLTDQERTTIAAAVPALRETEPKRVVEPPDLP